MDQEDSIFTKIIRGEIPCRKIYEDDLTIAFLPLHPIALAHILVVPKRQVVQFYELPEDEYLALWATVRKVANKMKEVINPYRVGLKVEGLDVPHAHVHVIAFDNHQQYDESFVSDKPENDEKLNEMAVKLAI